jgi:hypothetical protein
VTTPNSTGQNANSLGSTQQTLQRPTTPNSAGQNANALGSTQQPQQRPSQSQRTSQQSKQQQRQGRPAQGGMRQTMDPSSFQQLERDRAARLQGRAGGGFGRRLR